MLSLSRIIGSGTTCNIIRWENNNLISLFAIVVRVFINFHRYYFFKILYQNYVNKLAVPIMKTKFALLTLLIDSHPAMDASAVYLPQLDLSNRFIVLFGDAGSGKST